MYRKNAIHGQGQPLTSDDMDEVEQAIGIALPTSLREHYKKYNGGMLKLSTFVASNGNDFDFGSFNTMKWPRYPHEVLFEETYRKIVLQKALVPAAYVPFAVDGGGNFFCMKRSDETIYYFPMDSASGPPAKGEKIAENLVSLVEGMVESL